MDGAAEVVAAGNDVVREPIGPFRLFRAGTAMLTSPDTDGEIDETIASLVSALEADPRVLNVTGPKKKNNHFAGWLRVFPYMERPGRKEILSGEDRVFALNMDRPIVFQVRVPIKNQPMHDDAHDIPTDTYAVAWDGITAIVAWDQPEPKVPHSGGHIVLDVVESAAGRIGKALYRQACSPGCDYSFMHTTTVLRQNGSKENRTLELTPQSSPRRLVGMVPNGQSLPEAVEFLWLKLGMASVAFAQLKSTGQRVLDMEDQARKDVAHLLVHYYETARIRAVRGPRAIPARWSNRGWKHEARELMAGLWLTITNLETLTREWEGALRDLQGEYRSTQPLFSPEYEEDMRRIQKIETSTLVSAAEQVAAGLDSNAIALATSLGALGGAIAGALVGRL